MNALILSGGLGTRLRPLTLDAPKPLLPVANVPFLAYPMALLRKYGIRKAVLCTADAVAPYRKFIRTQKRAGTEIVCSRETKPLGTAGALKNAEKFINGPTFVFNGDVLTDADLGAMLRFHNEKKSKITVALYPVEDPSIYGSVETDGDGRVLQFFEKTLALAGRGQKTLINAGIYLFEPQIFDRIPKDQSYSTEKQLFPGCLKDGIPFYGFELNDSNYWLDIGTPEKYLTANLDAAERRLLGLGSARGAKNKIHRNAKLGKNVVIGNGCVVESGAVLDRALLLDCVRVGTGAALENFILADRAIVGNYAQLKGGVLGSKSAIGPYSKVTQ